MSRLTRRVAMQRPRGGGGRTYDEFVAHITALATSGSRAWGGQFTPSFSSTGVSALTTAAAPTGDMYGSPWGPAGNGRAQANGTSTCRAIQHSLPSEQQFLEQISNGRTLFYKTSSWGSYSAASVSRNGYTSIANGSAGDAALVIEVIYWDGSRAQRMQPSLGLGPEPYDW